MKEKGNSFIELLILMAVVSILSAVIIVKLPSRDALIIDAEAAFFVSKLRYLQEISCTTQRMYMEFLPVEAESAASFSVQSHECFIFQGAKIKDRHKYPPGMTAFADREDIFFGMNGTVAPLTIDLFLGNERRHIIIDRVGRIRVAR